MPRFRVWAPDRQRVELALGDVRVPMRSAAGGWWEADAADASSDVAYAFCVDGGPPRPDPRSPWQPQGIDGCSRTVDHAAFSWTDAAWQAPALADAVIYELHIGTFTAGGTFAAAIERLGDLVDLGVTHVEVMPIAEFSGRRGWGYDGVDLYAPHHAYGGPSGFKAFVDAAHGRGLAVVLDVVYNHLGPAGNYLGEFGPYFTDRYRSPWGPAVNFDGPGSDEVRRFVCDNACMWLRDYHVDALRIDAVHALFDMSAVHILEQLASAVAQLARTLGRPLALIAESDLNDPRVVRPPALGGYGIDAQWNDDFHHALHALLTGERDGYYADFGRIGDVAAALTQGYVFAGRYSAFRGRSHGRPPTGVSGSAFVGFLQNHDQIGNRALGERSSQLMTPGQLAIGAALVLTAPGVPLLFQGEEWGGSTPFQYFTAHEDARLAAAVRDGRRREFARFDWNADEVPDPQDEVTFLRSRLDWSERTRSPHRELLAWHRDLIALRRGTPALRDGRRDALCVRCDEHAGWLVAERGPIAVVCNFARRPQCVPLGWRGAQIALSASPDNRLQGEQVALAPTSVAVVRSARE
jgi:maltooligosyltrehalose trehalohydrolase